MKTLDEMIAVMQAAKDGKAIEWRRGIGNSDWECSTPAWNWNVCDYRIKPEPKLRPWKPEEVPVGALVRRKCYRFAHNLIISRDDGGAFGFIEDNTGLKWIDKGLHGDFEFSTDGGKTWKPCGVEES